MQISTWNVQEEQGALYCGNKSLGLGKGHRGSQENHEDDHGKTGNGEIDEIANTCNLQVALTRSTDKEFCK
jgi:hypothetical protein